MCIKKEKKTDKKIESCVRKRDWRFYTTCNACNLVKSCEHECKPNWFGRAVETVVVWWYRRSIRKGLRRTFAGLRRKDVKNLRYSKPNK